MEAYGGSDEHRVDGATNHSINTNRSVTRTDGTTAAGTVDGTTAHSTTDGSGWSIRLYAFNAAGSRQRAAGNVDQQCFTVPEVE